MPLARLFITLLALFVIFKIYLVIQADIVASYQQQLYKEEARVSKCVEEYHRNRCEDRVEALFTYCSEREECMNTPVSANLKTMVTSFGLVADILNVFCEKLTWKAVGLIALLILPLILYERCCGKKERDIKIDLTLNGEDLHKGEKKKKQREGEMKKLFTRR